MLSIVPAHIQLDHLREHALLSQFGSRLAHARQARGMSALAMAAKLGISRNTLKAAECGNPSVTMGTYLRILAALGMASDLALVASGAVESPQGQASKTVARRHLALEAQVAAGQRDARSLVAIPPDLARNAQLTFPAGAFGEAEPW